MPEATYPSQKFDPKNRYVTSYLFSSSTLGSIRLLLGFYALVTNLVVLIYDGVRLEIADTYFSYFTHLSYIGLTAWLWASGVQTVAFANALKNGEEPRYPLQSWPRIFGFLHEYLYTTIATFPFIVTIVYWVLLASSGSFSDGFNSWTNVSQHIMNSVFALFELLLTDLPPLRYIQLPCTIVTLGLYLGVAYITHSTQGFYPYAFLDPKKEGALLAAYILGIAAGQIIVFLIVRLGICLRILAVDRRRRGSLEHNHHDEYEKAVV
ncbi:hypothetical protein NP233_g1793 [Leucocoprinus birnbaumii]|uniref:Uncharacterized protein n=1 Tax=Leucocoprinus birnbaumii TaxID=56174 RepID=A0AAD5W1X8_9AGAR|nr:hypothetical protein NP233_g1793 [Leucocoprinus birnbaumii]